MYTRSARIDAMIETYREGAADKKCDKCKKGRGKCSKCSHEKEEGMKEDGLSADEYLAACELRIQNQSRPYIRARLDAAGMKMKGKGIKCGNGYISQGETCGGATNTRAKVANTVFGKGERNLFNANHSIKSGAKVGAQRGALNYGLVGGAVGLLAGGPKGLIKGAVGGAVGGAALGTVVGAASRGAAKAVRAGKRNAENNARFQKGLKKPGEAYTTAHNKLKTKKGKVGREQFLAASNKIEDKYLREVGKVYSGTRTNIWSNKNEKRKPGRMGI